MLIEANEVFKYLRKLKIRYRWAEDDTPQEKHAKALCDLLISEIQMEVARMELADAKDKTTTT